MILGVPSTGPDVVYFVMVFGQSNADGRATAVRLGNTNWNYQGISTGYPAVRTTQPVYSATPSNVYIYNKGTTTTFDNQSADNGTWEDLSIGVNNAKKGAVTAGFLGVELSLSVNLQQYSGKDIYIVKAGFAATSLFYEAAPSIQPGSWQFTNRVIAMEYYLRRAVRDFRIANPNKRAVPLCVYWWQGENDAAAGRTAAQHKSDLDSMRAYMDGVIRECFVMDHGQSALWILSLLDFSQNAAEGVINTGINDHATGYGRSAVVNPAPYPRRSDLSVSERLPGNGGSTDDNHSSYIAMQAMGELAAQEVIDHGIIQPA